MQIDIHRTKSGKPALWEKGGGASNTGSATIIAGRKGKELTAYYIKRRGETSNGEHALVPLFEGGWIVQANHHKGDFSIVIYKVKEVSQSEDKATLETVATFSENEWDTLPPEFLNPAILAARRKATTYHCREACFAQAPEPKAVPATVGGAV